MRNSLIFLTLFFLSFSAEAASKTFFFGGAQAQKGQMDSCLRGSRNFEIAQWQGAVSSVVAEINKPENIDKSFTIVGHSSGCKYANMVASRAKNPKRITLVNLDGYPPRNVPSAVKRICWKATNGRGLNSRNAGWMSAGNNCQEVKTATAPQCSTKWCLHFAMVNAIVPGNLNNRTWVSQGYSRCNAFPGWQK